MAYIDKIAKKTHKPIISRYNMQSERIIHFCIRKSCFKVYKKNGRPSEFYHSGGYRLAPSFYLHFSCSASFLTLAGNSALLTKINSLDLFRM